MVGEPRSVPPGLDLSAYRIVQEALTNALTHAGPARARVTVRYGEREVELEIADDGHGDSGESGGHGLTGMRERFGSSAASCGAGVVQPADSWCGHGPAGSMIRVLIADDQALVRAGFRAILEAEDDLDVVGEAAGGRDAVALAHETEPDVVLMDIRMPDLDGIEATRRLLKAESPPKVLMLTTFDLDEYLYEAMRAGASGFRSRTCPGPASWPPSAPLPRDACLRPRSCGASSRTSSGAPRRARPCRRSSRR